MHLRRGRGQRVRQGALRQHGLLRGGGQARLLLRGQGRAVHGARAGLRACVCMSTCTIYVMIAMCYVHSASCMWGPEARLRMTMTVCGYSG